MSILKSRVFVGLSCFVVGALSVLAAQRITAERQKGMNLSERRLHFKNGAVSDINSLFDDFYSDDFFSQAHDPFEQMRQMRNRMMKDFDEPHLVGGDVGEIKRREDKGFVYYDIGIKGLDQKNFKFKIADGQIIISGQTENKSEDNGSGTYFSSSFHRSFPVPPEVDGKRVQVEQNKDQVTLKFPKVSATS